LSKQAKVHFLTAYQEYLYDEGIKSEDTYLGDASRFLRHLIRQSTLEDIEAFVSHFRSPGYRRRLRWTLRKFYAFAVLRLGVERNPLDESCTNALDPIDNP